MSIQGMTSCSLLRSHWIILRVVATRLLYWGLLLIHGRLILRVIVSLIHVSLCRRSSILRHIATLVRRLMLVHRGLRTIEPSSRHRVRLLIRGGGLLHINVLHCSFNKVLYNVLITTSIILINTSG